MRITFIGSGNVATHMAAAFKNAGHRIVQVYSPNNQHAQLLAYHVGASATTDLEHIDEQTDIFIIAVKDDAINEVCRQLAVHHKPVVHTSGATSIQTLLTITENAGVIYPLQTFSKEREVDFRQVPLCIEGGDYAITAQLVELARTISNSVQLVDSAQRKILHLAAVFACNFPNYLYEVSRRLLGDHQLNFDLLRPLIKETANKVQSSYPASVQTGPAIRNDTKTIDAHMQLLANDVFLQNLYQLLSEGIMKMDETKRQPE